MQHKTNWYCLYVRSFHEKTVAIKIDKLGFKTYLPTIEQVRQWSDRKKKIRIPLFRGYLFVKAAASETWRLLMVDAVMKFLGTGDTYSIILEEEIEKIERIVETGWSVDILESTKDLIPGSQLEISEGPFQGMGAQLIRRDGQHFALVGIESLGQTLKIKMPIPVLKAI